MSKKELKNPVTVIRQPKDIDQEYSKIVFELGVLEVQLEGLNRQIRVLIEQEQGFKKQKDSKFARVQELSDEMTEARNKELNDKKATEALNLVPTEVTK